MVSRVIEGLKPLLSDRGEEVLFTAKTLAVYLGVSEKWVYERVQFKEIPYAKLGGNVRFIKKDIDNWIDDQKVPVVNRLSKPLKAVK
jgi:excisionase family DNA binding protein